MTKLPRAEPTPTARDLLPVVSEAPDLPPTRGATIGRYVLLDVLGKGGVGIVYAAYDPKLDRKIAIKVLRPHDRRAVWDARDRLLREAQAMARLSHPNVVAVHDVGAFEEGVFLAMELVVGTTLRGWLEEDSHRSWRSRLAAVTAAGRGLAAAHAANIVHRDFKLDNVLVGRDGRVRVTDFGIARSTFDGSEPSPVPSDGVLGSPEAPLDGSITAPGSVLGTVGYMAPEQAYGEEADARSDQFSFCATLYVALYGERPFDAVNLGTYTHALSGPVRDAPRGTGVPVWLRRVVLRGLERAKDDRYPSMDALLEALERDPATVRRRWATVLAVTSIIVLGIASWRVSAQRQVDACRSAPSLTDVWDEDVKRRTREAFVASGAPNGADAFARSAAVLDTYAAAWSSMYTDACAATRVRHEQPEELYRLRGDCLTRQRVELRALTVLLRSADQDVVETSIRAAYGLPAPSWCADGVALRSNVGLPDDPEKRARVLEARLVLAEADALQLIDKSRDALPKAKRALELAHDAGHPGTASEARYLVGRLESQLGDEAAAERSLTNAAWDGLASGELAVVVRASAILAYIAGVEHQQGEEARDWLGRATAALHSMGGNDELFAFVTSKRAAILQSLERRPELALPLAEEAVRTYRRLLGAHPSTERELINLGDAYVAMGRADVALGAYSESLQIGEQLYGPDSLRTGVSLAHVGDAHLKLGEFDVGTLMLERALGIFERYGNSFWVVAALQDLTRSANRSLDPRKALLLGERGLALLDEPVRSQVLVPASCVGTAEALLALGRATEALALCNRALQAQEAAHSIEPAKVYEWDALRCRGESLIALHRPAEALAALERSVTLTRREWPGDLARARFALARALRDVHADDARIQELAGRARDELASHPDMKAEVAGVETWLAQHAGHR